MRNFPIITILLILTGCQEADIETHSNNLLGQWVSEDKNDTLHFVNDSSLYKNSNCLHFDYSVQQDSIIMSYSGCLLIFYPSSTHYIKFDANKLTIDFTNELYYGFGNELMHYNKISENRESPSKK